MDIYITTTFVTMVVLVLLFSRFYGFKKISKDIEASINPYKNFSQPETDADFFMPKEKLPDLDPANTLDQVKAKLRLLPIKILVYTFTFAAILLASALLVAPLLTIATEKLLFYFK